MATRDPRGGSRAKDIAPVLGEDTGDVLALELRESSLARHAVGEPQREDRLKRSHPRGARDGRTLVR